MCWHSSGGSAADALRIRLAGAVDVRSLRTAWRLAAPGWLAQLYAGTLVSMDKDGRIIRTFVTEPRLPVTDSASNTGRLWKSEHGHDGAPSSTAPRLFAQRTDFQDPARVPALVSVLPAHHPRLSGVPDARTTVHSVNGGATGASAVSSIPSVRVASNPGRTGRSLRHHDEGAHGTINPGSESISCRVHYEGCRSRAYKL